MNKLLVTSSALIIIAVLASVAFLNLNDANVRNAELQKQLSDLQDQMDNLQTKYYSLLGNYSYLEWNFTNVLMTDPYYVPNPGDTGVDNATLQARLRALQEMYNTLRNQYNTLQDNYQELRTETNLRLLRGSANVFITPDHPDVLNLVHNITSRKDNSTSSINWGDIKALYDWVNSNIAYREDGLYPALPEKLEDIKTDGLEHTDQMAQYPNETLQLKMGDCEDQAALLCSMVRAYFNKQFTAECIWITGATAGHIAVIIPFSEDKIVILDPIRDYFSHDTLGDISLNSVGTEIYTWINIWRPSLGNDVHVYRVFSDYMDKYFDTTEQYITWMYNR